MNTRRRVEWSSLPDELLTAIGERLDTRIDVLRFRAVCRPWRTSIPLFHKNSPRFPINVCHPIVYSNPYFCTPPVIYFTLTESTLYLFKDKNSKLSGGGWLVKVEESKPSKFRVLNPFCYRHQIKKIPKKLNLLDYRVFELSEAYRVEFVSCGYAVTKAIFSADDSLVFFMYNGGYMVFFRLGDDKWTQLSVTWDASYSDIILYKGKFHAVDGRGKVVVIDSSTMKITEVSNRMDSYGGRKYLVQSCGDLCVVVRSLDRARRVKYYDEDAEVYYFEDNNCVGKTGEYFEIYRLNEADREWVKVESLSDQVVFLSDHCSFFSSAKEVTGCGRNCIYLHSEEDVNVPTGGFHRHGTGLFNLTRRGNSQANLTSPNLDQSN